MYNDQFIERISEEYIEAGNHPKFTFENYLALRFRQESKLTNQLLERMKNDRKN